MPYYLLPDMFYVAIIDNALDMCILCWLVHIDYLLPDMFFRWLDKNPCPCSCATTSIVWERFMRLVAEAEVAKNERDDGRRMEAEALEQEWIAKCRAEKSRVAT